MERDAKAARKAAGAAAALSVQAGVQPRAVNIGQLQDLLLAQGVYLRKAGQCSEQPGEPVRASAAAGA